MWGVELGLKMQILILSDGGTTRVYDAETGEWLENVRKVTFSHEAGGIPVATLEIILPRTDFMISDPTLTAEDEECSKPNLP
jgi:hypothetical protein